MKRLVEIHPTGFALLRDPHSWVAGGLVALIWSGHYTVEAFHPEHGPPLTFLLESLFLIPVVYAALNFGLRGAAVTAVGCTLITVPNWVLFHSVPERTSVMTQMAIAYGVAMFVGHRVDRERSERIVAEGAVQALNVFAARYRALFESAGEGILLLRGGDQIAEGNAAAEELFGLRADELTEARIADALPPSLASALAGPPQARSDLEGDVRLITADGQERWVEPVRTQLPASDGLTQVVLRDVTARHRRVTALESYAAEILRAQEEERTRLGQEIHDDTMQSLVLICRSLDAIGDGQEIEEVKAQLADLRGLAESTHDSLRVLLGGLRPALLDDLGLTAALGSLVAGLEERMAIHVHLDVEGDARRLPPERELALYRIAQEALRNMERHSGASEGTVTVRFEADDVELRVRDNGRGFDLLLGGEGHLGVLGMRERARVVGGDFKIQSYPGGGTTVMATVPDRVATAV